MAASADKGSYQEAAIENGRGSDLGPVKRGYFTHLSTKGEHSLLVRVLGHP